MIGRLGSQMRNFVWAQATACALFHEALPELRA
jgi:hypothetical protein